MKKIFCFINSVSSIGYDVVALSEGGKPLAGHISSTEWYAKHDIGMTSDWKHDKYKEEYPDGYELIWLTREELESNSEFQKALQIANNES